MYSVMVTGSTVYICKAVNGINIAVLEVVEDNRRHDDPLSVANAVVRTLNAAREAGSL